jgi:hypothetical protein
MPKYKALGDFEAAVGPGGTRQHVTAGEVHDLPDTQDGTPDGEPLVWSPEYWQPVKTTKKEG